MKELLEQTKANEELEKLKHDLRGPLTIVQNFFEELESVHLDGVLSESQRELLVLAKKAVARMVDSIRGRCDD